MNECKISRSTRKLAIIALRAQLRKKAFDANLHDRLGIDTALAVNASKERKRILQAIEELSDAKK